MRLLPRSFEYRIGDTAEGVATRVAEWARDVRKSLARVPDVEYVTVPWTGDAVSVFAAGGAPRSVVVARVVDGTVTAAPGVEWEPVASGFRMTAVHGVSAPATLLLRVEVL